MTTIYLQRHGQSVSNAAGLLVGQDDYDLSELGFKQSEASATVLTTKPITAVYASDLKRAVQTAQATAASLCLSVTQIPELREIYAGVLESLTYEEVNRVHGEAYGQFFIDPYLYPLPGGETAGDVEARFVPAMKRLAESHDGEHILVTSHATAIAIFLSYAEGAQYRPGRYSIPNTSITTLTYEDGIFTVRELANADHLTTSSGEVLFDGITTPNS